MNLKKIFIAAVAILISGISHAQGFMYCASIANPDGSPSAGETIQMKFNLVSGEGATVYSEAHDNLTTDANGMFSAVVGTGSKLDGDFDSIDWADDAISVHVEFTRADGSSVSDDFDLGSTPAAIGAQTASTLTSARTDDGRYTLAVDDNGNLTTVLDPSEIIAIPAGYSKILFHDEFNVDGMLDTKYWSYEEGSPRNGEMQYYTVARPENAYIKDGLLHIVTLNDNWVDADGQTHAVTSASVNTKDKVAFTYGRVDIRAKLPICLGSWPALWMMPNKDVYGYWPNSGEIDIMEHVGFNPYTVFFTAHCAEQNGNDNKWHNSASVPTCTTEFHVYTLEWSESRLDWLVDGKRKWTVVKSSNTWRGWPFNQDFYFMMNTAFGGSWGAQHGVDLEALPITFEIDYVRIFQ